MVRGNGEVRRRFTRSFHSAAAAHIGNKPDVGDVSDGRGRFITPPRSFSYLGLRWFGLTGLRWRWKSEEC